MFYSVSLAILLPANIILYNFFAKRPKEQKVHGIYFKTNKTLSFLLPAVLLMKTILCKLPIKKLILKKGGFY